MASPSNKPHYFTIEEAIRIHKLVMSGTNQPPQAIKDLISKNTLGSALARPKQLAHYEAADPIRQAALMCISISQAQAFVDGNKRTAFAITEAFLKSAGLKIAPGSGLLVAEKLEEVAQKLIKTSNQQGRDELENEFEHWLRLTVVPYADQPSS
jgi:death-on-curing family protein